MSWQIKGEHNHRSAPSNLSHWGCHKLKDVWQHWSKQFKRVWAIFYVKNSTTRHVVGISIFSSSSQTESKKFLPIFSCFIPSTSAERQSMVLMHAEGSTQRFCLTLGKQSLQNKHFRSRQSYKVVIITLAQPHEILTIKSFPCPFKIHYM